MNIYVGGLSYETTDDDLRQLFGQYGEVTNVHVPTDRQTGQPRGFAFVEMSSDDDARSAIEALDGSDVAGRAIKVAEARPRADRPADSRASAGPRGEPAPASGEAGASAGEGGMKIYVGNLPFQTTDDELRALFAQHGDVSDVHLPTDRQTGRPRGFAFVQMPDSDQAQAAMEALDGTELGGRILAVNRAREGGGRRREGGGRRRGPGGGGPRY